MDRRVWRLADARGPGSVKGEEAAEPGKRPPGEDAAVAAFACAPGGAVAAADRTVRIRSAAGRAPPG